MCAKGGSRSGGPDELSGVFRGVGTCLHCKRAFFRFSSIDELRDRGLLGTKPSSRKRHFRGIKNVVDGESEWSGMRCAQDAGACLRDRRALSSVYHR
jgi:hypothetical protein